MEIQPSKHEASNPAEFSSISAIRDFADLPAEAWKGFFIVAMKRLEKVKPNWVEMTYWELENFQLTWRLCDFVRSQPRGPRWMAEAFRHMENRSLATGAVKPEPDVSPRSLLSIYAKMLREVQKIKKGEKDLKLSRRAPIKNLKDYWRSNLRILMDSLARPGKQAKITPALLKKACHESRLRRLTRYSTLYMGQTPNT